MRLRKSEIELIAKHISDSLLEHGCVQTDDVTAMRAQIVRVIHDDLKVEDELNEEVRKLLEAHSAEISKSNVEYHNMFNLVKRKLIRERGLIL